MRFDHLGAFVVHHIEGGSIAVRSKSGEDVKEGRNHGSIVLGGHCTHEDCVEIVDVDNEDVLHILEGAHWECTGEVRVHCARV